MMGEKQQKLIRNISVPVGREGELDQFLKRKIKHLHYDNPQVKRRSLDARHRNHLRWQYNILVEIKGQIPNHSDILDYHEPQPYITTKKKIYEKHPFIIGAGPAGLFCALAMVERNLEPWIFEQGDQLKFRNQKVKIFQGKGELDPESNIQFGEGGAGTYSDGKLTARNRDYYSDQVFKYLVKFGADKNILIDGKPHLGTDTLQKLIVNIRRYLEKKGVMFFWRHKLKEIGVKHNKVIHLSINEMGYSPEIVVLATGNSARDVFCTLHYQIPMESKTFAIGFRIEHKQSFLNDLFYGEKTDIGLTGAAGYRLTSRLSSRNVYSFCMCPGGIVINGVSEKGGIVTNGMSNSNREGSYGNSALVVQVDKRDYGTAILSGLEFQRKLEQKCWQLKKDYSAPVQKAGDFLKGKVTFGNLNCSFRPGVFNFDLSKIYPRNITEALQQSIYRWNSVYPGFGTDGILIAPETRTSSPVRIIRDHQSLCSPKAENLYPVGEGAGYAGGIISSAADGFKTGSIFNW